MSNINNRLKNENQKNIKKEFEYLSTQLNNFSEKIKKASYGNDKLKKIKKANNNLKDVIQTIDIDILNNSKIEELNSSINLYENEEEKNFKNYSNFSFVKELSIIYEKDDSNKNKISLVCSNCSSKAIDFCNNICFNYFCESCKNELDLDICSHNFEKIKEKKEKEKIEFTNSFLYIIKKCCIICDNIFKSNNEDNTFPLLKKPDEIDSQINFLLDIYHLKNIKNINTNNIELCELIKKFLINTLDLNKSSLDKIEGNLFSSEEEISIRNRNTIILIGETGVGKSTLGNHLLGEQNFKKCEKKSKLNNLDLVIECNFTKLFVKARKDKQFYCHSNKLKINKIIYKHKKTFRYHKFKR